MGFTYLGKVNVAKSMLVLMVRGLNSGLRMPSFPVQPFMATKRSTYFGRLWVGYSGIISG